MRNVFATFCVLLNATPSDVCQQRITPEPCFCSGRLKETSVRVFYYLRLFEFEPFAPVQERLDARRSIVFAGMSMWITWPTPALSDLKMWSGFAAWSGYEMTLTRMHNALFPKARAVHVVTSHSLCGWARECTGDNYPFRTWANTSEWLSACTQGLVLRSEVTDRTLATACCTRGVRCESNIQDLNRRMKAWADPLLKRTAPIDAYSFTKDQCWANEVGDNIHFRRLLVDELALYVERVWPGSTEGFRARTPR